MDFWQRQIQLCVCPQVLDKCGASCLERQDMTFQVADHPNAVQTLSRTWTPPPPSLPAPAPRTGTGPITHLSASMSAGVWASEVREGKRGTGDLGFQTRDESGRPRVPHQLPLHLGLHPARLLRLRLPGGGHIRRRVRLHPLLHHELQRKFCCTRVCFTG